MTHLEAQESKDSLTRTGWEWCLVRLLYQRGHSREQVLDLFRLLDWMLPLPQALEHEIMHELIAFEEQTKMPHISSVERFGQEKGRQQGEATILLHLLTLKFGPQSESVCAHVQTADPDTLLRWSALVLTAMDWEEVWSERDA